MAKAKAKRGITEFRALYDRSVIVPRKIQEALGALETEQGPDAWEPEGDFIRRAAVSQSDMGKFRDKFAAHTVDVKTMGRHTSGKSRRIWFARKKAATRARAVVSL